MQCNFGIDTQDWQTTVATELTETPPIQWILEGYVAKGLKTELVGIWNSGKTTLVAELLRCMREGETLLGRQVAKSNALIVTEESPAER